MKILVGLGNPKKEYLFTRHNLGFMLIDALAENNSFQKKHDSLIQKIHIEGQKVLLAKPQTFMNLSGQALKKIMDFYKAPLENLLVIHDDKDQAFGKIKFQKSRGHGGHNGVRDIHKELQTNDYARLKMGIGASHQKKEGETQSSPLKEGLPDKDIQPQILHPSNQKQKYALQDYDSLTWRSIFEDSSNRLNKTTADYVLSPFNQKEKEKLPAFLEQGLKAVHCFVLKGYTTALNQFNSREKA